MKHFIPFALYCLMWNIAATQNVGVGIATPAYRLDVRGGINTDSLYRITGFPVLSITGLRNLFAGRDAGLANIGSDNTFIGHRAGFSNTDGSQNIACGTQALYSNNEGSMNVAMGSLALFNNTTGYGNTANGVQALIFNSTGYDNTAYGSLSLHFNTTGYCNTGIGFYAGVVIGDLNNATALGANAAVSASKTMSFGRRDSVLQWVFGRTSVSDAAYALQIGNTAVDGNGAYLTKTGNWTNTSSRLLKEDFTDLEAFHLLQQIKQLPIQRWKYKGSNEFHIGPVSQDFYRIFQVGADDQGISTIDPAGIALAGIKAQQQLIEEQKSQIEFLQKENELFKKMLADLKKEIEELKKRN